MIDSAVALRGGRESGSPTYVEDPPRAARPRAHKRLGLVGFNFAYRFLAGLLIAGPIAAILSGPVANQPRGDAALFDPGGVMLLEALRLAGRGAAGATTASGAIALLATFLGLLPFAALVAGLGREGRLSRGYLAARAIQPMGTLALIWGLGLLAQAILAVIVTLLGGKLVGALHLDSPREDIARLVLTGVVLLAVIAAGVVRDLSAVSAVNDGTRLYTSVQRALRAVGHAGGRVALAYATRGVLALAAVGGAVALASALSGVPVMPFVVHQAGIAGVVFFQASWLAAAIGLLEKGAPMARASEAPAVVEAPVVAEPAVETAPAPEAAAEPDPEPQSSDSPPP